MILHLCEDEKFIDHVIELFESVSPNRNIYYIQPISNDNQLKLVKTQHPNIISKPIESDEFKQLVKRLESFDAVILHNLYNPYKQDVVQAASLKVHFHWMCWGADLYSIYPLSRKIKSFRTIVYEYKRRSIRENIWHILYENASPISNLLYLLKYKQQHPRSSYLKILKRINSVSSVLQSEFVLIKNYTSPDIKYYPFKFSTLEKTLGESFDSICTEENFFVGNSATLSNNHLDSIALLKKIEIKNLKIYAPLSYGDKAYGDYIEKTGKEMLGSSFQPLRKFISIEEYNDILNKCGNVIMNHFRQQALDNIKLALWKGARVFLSKKNPTYSFLKSHGIIVFEISDIKRYNSLPDFKSLSEHNRPIINNIYKKEVVIEETQNLVNYLKSKQKKNQCLYRS